MNNLIPSNKNCSSASSFISKDGIEISNKKEIAETFNNYFASIGSPLASAFNFTGTSHICPLNNKNVFNFSQDEGIVRN